MKPREPTRRHMRRRLRNLSVILIAVIVMFGLGVGLWLRRDRSPPSISIDLLGYTNRIGPSALLAITNRSESAITLDSMCLVKYSSGQGISGPRITSIDANMFRVTRLLPSEGFVQEVSVFPASQNEWQFEFYAAYSSAWLETRRATENWLRKQVGSTSFRLASKAWHKFDTAWVACPP